VQAAKRKNNKAFRRHRLDEVPHGACGTMLAREIAVVQVALWERIDPKD
jgi:hypothetical protein